MSIQEAARGSNHLIARRELYALTGLSQSTIDRLEHANRFPRRRRVSARAVRWLFAEVQAWIESREWAHPAGASGIERSLPTGDRD